jgi:twinkle protein
MKTISPKEISQRLTSRAEEVCRWLLPNGKLVSGEWCVGSTAGEAGQSCKVRVEGERAGIWADFAGDAKGDLLDLIREVKQCRLGIAIKEAKQFLGISDPELLGGKKYRKPIKTPPRPIPAAAIGRLEQYLTGERKIPQEIVARYKVSQLVDDMVFPSYDQLGELINVKYIGMTRSADGKKRIRQEAGCAPCLFGWHAIKPDARVAIITEGQIDAMTWAAMGANAFSIPNGTGDCETWIDYEWENLEQFDTIILSFDTDKPGIEAVERVSKRLGRHRCMRVTLEGFKDANEALMAGKTKEFFIDALNKATPFKPPEIVSPMDMKDKVMAEMFPKDGKKAGFWPVTLGGLVGFRSGELSIWTGISGHGKSTLLLQLMLEATGEGMSVGIASMEMPAQKTLAFAVQMNRPEGMKAEEMNPDTAETVLDALSGFLWIFNLQGEIPVDQLIALMEYGVARHGMKHIVIDSLMKLDVASDDFDKQRQVLNKLVNFSRSSGCHIHLVCHPKKTDDEGKKPGKMDIKGSSDIFNQADNILAVWRNRAKEEDQAQRSDGSKDFRNPDTICYLEKDREFGLYGNCHLFFNPSRRRFLRLGPSGKPIVPRLYPRMPNQAAV